VFVGHDQSMKKQELCVGAPEGRVSEVCFRSSRATGKNSQLHQICIRDFTNTRYLISTGTNNKIGNRGYGRAGEAGEPGVEVERPDEQYETSIVK
jgi:hypothetical protein